MTRCAATRHREAEANRITGLLAVPCAAGFVAGVWPGAVATIGAAVAALLALVVALAVLRVLARRARERREDRAALLAYRKLVRSPR